MRDQYVRSLLPHGDQTIAGQLEKHVLKPMLAILIWRTGLSLGSYFWQSNYNWVVDRWNMNVEDLIMSQLQSEEEFTDQKSLPQDLTCHLAQFMTKLKLFHVVERKMYHPFVNSTKSLIFDLTKILLPIRLVLTYRLIAKVMHYHALFTELKSSC